MAAALGRLGVVAAATVLLAVPGCKNPCERAVAHTHECLQAFCAAHPENRGCAQLSEPPDEVQDCIPEYARAAAQVLDQSCDDMTASTQDYATRALTIEAEVNLRGMSRGARSYFEMEHVDPAGDIASSQFPASAARTPAVVPCGQAAPPQPALWEQPTWQALEFTTDDEPFRYSYQFDSTGQGDGATFTASAFGDLDCDGFLSTFTIVGRAADTEVTLGELLSSQEHE